MYTNLLLNNTLNEELLVMQPLVSFIIPVYNVEDYLRQCIDSIIYQNLPSYEIILINDGSTDKSPDICNEYAKKYETVQVIHSKNQGQSAARNKGIAEANGKYIFFLDSDDYYIQGTINKFIKAVTDNKDIDLVVGKIKIFYQDTNVVSSKCQYSKFDKIKGMTGEEALKYLIKTNQFLISPYSYMVKRSILIENNIMFDEKLRYAEDIIFTPKVYFFSKKVSCVDDYFLMYRKNRDGQITQKFNIEKERIVLKILENWVKDINSWNLASNTKKIFKRYIGNIYVSSLGKHQTNQYKEAENRRILLSQYVHLIKYCGGKRFIFLKFIYYLFGLNACMKIAYVMKKIYDKIK